MSVKEITQMYKNQHENDGWGVLGYRVPEKTKFN